LGCVLLSCFVEAAVLCATLEAWNSSGFQPVHLNMLSGVARAFKSFSSYMLALALSLGWGVTRPRLARGTVVKAIILCVLMVIADMVHSYLSSCRNPNPMTVYLSWVPVALLSLMIYGWIYRALHASIEMTRERKQEQKLILFQRLWNMLVVAMSLAAIAVPTQQYVLTRSLDASLRYQWLFSDAGSHVLDASVVVAMMYLWVPTKRSQRDDYAQIGNDKLEAQMEQDCESPTAAVKDVVLVKEEYDVCGSRLKEAEEDAFSGATIATDKVAPEPDRIGVSVDDELQGTELL